MKYIETELKKRKGIVEHEEQKVKPKNAEDCLYELPENIRVSSAKKTEEMLSNQMLSGIPEVDLGIEYVQTLASPLSCPRLQEDRSAFQLEVRGTISHRSLGNPPNYVLSGGLRWLSPGVLGRVVKDT